MIFQTYQIVKDRKESGRTGNAQRTGIIYMSTLVTTVPNVDAKVMQSSDIEAGHFLVKDGALHAEQPGSL